MRKIILFDFDGTLADSVEIGRLVVDKVFRKYGLPGLDSTEKFTTLYDKNFFDSAVDWGLKKSEMVVFLEDVNAEILKYFHVVGLFAGAKELLKRLDDDGHLMFIITSNFSKVVEKVLKEKSIDCIEKVLGAEVDINKVKKINSVRAQYPGEDFWLVGDTTGDILEGKKAGVKTVAVTWGYHNQEKLNKVEPDYVVNSFDELEELLYKN